MTAHDARSVEAPHKGLEAKSPLLNSSEGPDRHLAPSFKVAEQGALTRDALRRGEMVKFLHHLPHSLVVLPCLDPERSLPDSGKKRIARKNLGHAFFPSEPFESRV